MSSSRLAEFRAHKDQFFAHSEHSPLPPEDRASFTGLDYFPENPALSFVLPLQTDGPGIGETVELPTTDGRRKPFVRAGRITFTVNGTPVTFSVFKEPVRGRYFLPFRDGTAGKETYSLGRYLDPQELPDGRLRVDFNYAYNPYCAYAEGWSCPIPPEENVTSVRIEAGEKAYRRPGSRQDSGNLTT